MPTRRASVSSIQATAQQNADSTWTFSNVGEANGTWHAGRPVREVTLGGGETIVIGGDSYSIDGDSVRRIESTGLSVEFASVSARYPGTNSQALTDVSFRHDTGVLAVVGPSGAGKSSGLKALLGELEITGGVVRAGGVPLTNEQAWEFLGQYSAYVPQADDVHELLSVEETLHLTSRLRQARDVSREERGRRVDDLIELLGLTVFSTKPASSLSGGQKKRLSVGMEIVADPALLLLDEPTSGLDPGKDRQLMELLRAIAEKGTTVMVVTHSTAHLHLVDAVLVVRRGGAPVYHGPPEEVLSTLGASDWSELMTGLDENPERFTPLPARPRAVEPPVSTDGTTRRRPPTRPLVDRQIRLLRRRGLPAALSMAATPIIGAVLAAVAASGGLSASPRADPSVAMAIAILVTVAALGGAALTYDDIVTERRILQRDLRAQVSPSQIIVAKSIVGAVVAAVLGTLTVVAYRFIRPGLDDPALRLVPDVFLALVIVLVFVASMMMGMAISAWSGKLTRAVSMSTVLAVAQVALSGLLFPIPAWLNVATLGVPARWGTSALASAMDLNAVRVGAEPDPLWEPGGAFVLSWCAILALQIIAFGFVAREGLARKSR